MSIYGGIAGRRGHNPKGAFIHNDAAGQSCNANHYATALRIHPAANGFAHDYSASDYILSAEDVSNCAWHCGNSYYNNEYYSIECCQSFGDLNIFMKNEDNALKLVAQHFKEWGITPNNTTVMLHCEVFATACPHRSMEIHGGTVQSTKNYFISKISEYMGQKTNISTQTGYIATEETFNKMIGGEIMQAVFTIDNGACVYWFHDSMITGFAHPDELKIVCDLYKANYGKDIPTYKFTSSAPWHKRLLDVVNRSKVTKF